MSRSSSRRIYRAGRHGPRYQGGVMAASAPAGGLSDSLRLFATGWIGGLVFFAMLLA